MKTLYFASLFLPFFLNPRMNLTGYTHTHTHAHTHRHDVQGEMFRLVQMSEFSSFDSETFNSF